MRIYNNLYDNRGPADLSKYWNSKNPPPSEEDIGWLLNHLDRNLDHEFDFPSISDVSPNGRENRRGLLSLWWQDRRKAVKLLCLDIPNPLNNGRAHIFGHVETQDKQDQAEGMLKDLFKNTNIRFQSKGGDHFTFEGEIDLDNQRVWRREISGALRILREGT